MPTAAFPPKRNVEATRASVMAGAEAASPQPTAAGGSINARRGIPNVLVPQTSAHSSALHGAQEMSTQVNPRGRDKDRR